MTQFDAMWDRAESFLTIARPDGKPDLFLWEHAARTARSASRISTIPEIAQFKPDRCAVEAGALFHNAAWVHRIAREESLPFEVLLKPIDADHFTSSATSLEEQLEGLVPQDSIERGAAAVRLLGEKGRDLIEGKIVSDAANLDEFGISSLCKTLRRGLLDGLAIQAAIDRWKRRAEYHYWNARMSDSFCFEATRELARARLANLERIMAGIECEQYARDIVTGTSLS